MKLLSIPDTAERLDCCNKHVYNLISAGLLKPTDISIGSRSKTRISDAEIDRYIASVTRATPAVSA